MRWTRVPFALLVGLCVSTLVAGCVGDDPGSNDPSTGADGGPLTGELQGPCFKDGTCKQGLLCDPDLKLCRSTQGQSDGGGPNPPSDSGTDAPADASEAGSCNALTVAVNNAQSFPCPSVNGTTIDCQAGMACCPAQNGNGAKCTANDPDGGPSCGGPFLTCVSSAQCGNNGTVELCCASVASEPSNLAACPDRFVDLKNTSVICGACVGTASTRFCPTVGANNGCLQNETCKAAIAKFGTVSMYVNICQ
jgi:hypothetical protein